jgi:voltage-gated potassium channel
MDQAKATGPAGRGASDNIYDLFILALTVFSLLLVGAYYLFPLTEATREALLWLDLPISLLFLVDFLRSLRRAPDKRAYLKWGWVDLLGSIPLVLPLRIARLGRLVRAWRTLRLRRLSQVGDDLDQNRAQSAALITVLLAIVVLTVATVAVLEFESEVPQTNIRTPQDAFWWSVVTMATVGYGDHYPITAGGRMAAVALMTVGVGIFGVLASFLANLFLPRTPDDALSPDLAEIKAELAALNARLDSLGEQLGISPAGPPPVPDPTELDTQTADHSEEESAPNVGNHLESNH